jgi:hypothetical protein
MRSCLAFLLLAFGSSNAETVVVDFDGSEDAGFEVEVLQGGVFYPDDNFPASNGTAVFGWCTACEYFGFYDTVYMGLGDQQTFDLLSLDIGANGAPSSGFTVQLFGYYGSEYGDGQVQTTFTVGDAWDTYYLDSAWQNLYSVELVAYTSALPAIDNITINVVPIPAAVWLFASGLGLLSWFRRRQTA